MPGLTQRALNRVSSLLLSAGSALPFVLLLVVTSNAQEALRWGADASAGAPYVFADPADPDRYIGYEKEMVEALANAMGRKPQMVLTDWGMIVSVLQNGSFDMIVNGLEPTEDRAKQIIFSEPYYIFRLQLTVRADEKRIRTLDDCRGLLVGTLVNTAASRFLADKKFSFREYDDPVGAYRDLELGRVDAVLMDVPMEMYYARRNPRLKPAGEPFHRGAYVIGLRKGDEALKAQVDAALEVIIRNGTLERILRKWDLWDDAQAELHTSIVSGQRATLAPFDITSASFNWTGAIIRLGRAAVVTVLLTFGAMLIALSLGLPLALGQWRGPSWLRALCTTYVEFFRGTPVLVQLLFLYFGLPQLGLVLPNWVTAIIGLGLNYAAYESQVYRSALEAIPRGQWEAAYSLGMTPGLAFSRVILPQSLRIALPAITNDVVSIFKDTSVAFAISVWELATAYTEMANASGEFLLLGAIVSCFYLLMSLPLARLSARLERKLQRRYIAAKASAP